MSFSIFGTDQSGTIGNIYYKYYFIDKNLPLMITFAPYGGMSEARIKMAKSPWGFEFIKKRNINVLSFQNIQGKMNYYRDKAFINKVEEIGQELPIFNERLGYGGSMGGYGVSAFSNPLKIDRLLLINPISSRKKDIASWDYQAGRMLKSFDYDWSGKYADGADSFSTGFVIYDPFFDLDNKHAVRYKKLRKLKFFGVGHGIPQYLQEMGILKMLVESFISNNLEPNIFYQEIRKRKRLKRYYEWMLSPQNKHSTPLRKKIIEEMYIQLMKSHLDNESFENDYYGFTTKLSSKDIDNIRNIAVKLEMIDINLAFNLMSLALDQRPSGKFIEKKVALYKKILKG